MTHPSSIVLESFAVGEALPATHAAHVATCAACSAYVDGLRTAVSAGPTANDAEAAVAKALAGLDGERATAMARANHDGREGASASTGPRPVAATSARRRRAWMLATSVITPLAAAAAILLLARGAPLPGSSGSPSAPTASPSIATVESPLANGGRVEPDTQFKGGMQVAVVRERGGKQERFSSTVRVRPGDRLRVEVALDREQAILGAVLADDGSYIELMPLGTRGPGTHFSERSAKIDGSPTRGTILIGTPEAVARARATRLLVGVDTLRVEWEGP